MTGAAVFALLFLSCWLLHPRPPLPPGGNRVPQADPSKPREASLDDPALMMDLMASMLAAGCSLEYGLTVLAKSSSPSTAAALASVKTALDLGARWDVAWATARPADSGAVTALGQALHFAGTTGAPSAAVVTAYAFQFRRRRNREAEKRAAALGVRLVVPLGLCSLPAFVCLGVFPILVGLFPAFS